MRRIITRTIVLGALAASLTTTPAVTAADDVAAPSGFLCGVSEVADPRPGAGPDDGIAEIDAGPATTDVPGTLVCTIQLGASTHAGADTVVREFPASPGGVIAGVETVPSSWPADAEVYVCSSFRTSDGSTSYFTRGAGWGTDPGTDCSGVLRPRVPPGSEPPGSPTGPLCGYTAAEDRRPGAGAGDMTGEVDAAAVTTVPGTLVCTIQVGSNTHSGPDAAVREFPDVDGVIAGVQPVSYTSPDDVHDSLCTSFRKADGTGTLYWTGGENGHWHTDPGKPCAVAVQGSSPDYWEEIDGTLCPLFAERHTVGPPATFDPTYIDDEGDVFVDTGLDGFSEADAMTDLFYDCPVHTFDMNDDNANPDRDDPANPGVIDW